MLAAEIISVYNTLNADRRISQDALMTGALKNIINDFCEELMRARYSNEKLFQGEMKSKMDAVKGVIDTMEPFDERSQRESGSYEDLTIQEKRGLYFMGERVAEYTYDVDSILIDVDWDDEKMKTACGKFLKKVQSI